MPILVFTIPVVAVVLLALGGRRLSGSCGGVGPDGSCGRCGKSAAARVAEGRNGEGCPS